MVTLLWDHDGVLVDTEALYFQATREVLAGLGVALSEAQYRECFLVTGSGAWQLALDAGVDAARIPALKQQRHARYLELLLSQNVAIPGALPLVRRLHRAGCRMAIVTSSERAHFEAIHRGGELPGLFELILTREDYNLAKPAPEPYLSALARMKVDPRECLVIEDSERGLRAAKAADLTCWVVPSGLTLASSFGAADRRFDDLSQLGAALLARIAAEGGRIEPG